jgi:sarcosine oxidase subunit alpha
MVRVPAEAIATGGAPVNLPWPIYPHPKGKDFVDFDEDLQVADIVNSVSEGYRDIELVKRFSSVGMGPSQGRQSALNAARIVAQARGVSAEAVGVTTARPPAFGEPLALLAGQGFHPERRTPMHERHLERSAQMIAVGAWWRPSYYGAPARRQEEIAAEVDAIHDNVGMIDVSTLGKIELRGPDAAAFLERIATFVYANQPVGSIRYHLMTNEAGTVIDDGIAARLDPEHFYMTATTGAVDNTFRQMQWWNAQWRMKVDIANVTGGYAAVNVAGPRSRELLTALAPDIDLSPASFPYLAVRAGQIAGIPARMLRIGFVGELGYEIHVPHQMGEALWDRLTDAGAALGVRPVGMEAQRTLRLEKGHIIIGQDTDGMTTPTELGMEWAVGKKKPFFIGSRSLAVRSRQTPKRRMVGFGLPLDGPVPQESCIIVHEGEMAGVVTSAARSRRCDRVIGLAYVPPELSAVGQDICIRLADRTDVTAKVTALPFYDPGQERLTC